MSPLPNSSSLVLEMRESQLKTKVFPLTLQNVKHCHCLCLSPTSEMTFTLHWRSEKIHEDCDPSQSPFSQTRTLSLTAASKHLAQPWQWGAAPNLSWLRTSSSSGAPDAFVFPNPESNILEVCVLPAEPKLPPALYHLPIAVTSNLKQPNDRHQRNRLSETGSPQTDAPALH